MISRALYPHRKGRQLLTLLATGALLVGTLAYAGTASAVHDEGVFQLDGNGTTVGEPNANIDNPASNLTGAHDWNQVYADCLAANPNLNTAGNAGGCGNSAFPSSGATHGTFVTDFTNLGDTILTGGSTKDINDIPSWLWNQTTTTSVQDKDDIEHAFAAQYDVVNSTNCGTIGNAADCKLLYFGADRFSNSGNTTMGFWFFQRPVGAVAGGTFSGQHVARNTALGTHGDILVVADFPNSSAAPAVSIYEWVTSGGNTSTHLDLIGGGTNSQADCTQGAAPKQNATPVPPVANGDNFCATVDANTSGTGILAPWPYTPKANSTGTTAGSNKWGTGEFMEGGINMTALGFGNECISSVLAETRSSNSPTSTLSDFTLGNFGQCGSTVTTTTGAATGDGTIGTGTVTSPTDSATVNVTGISTWSGSVNFYLCGPLTGGALCTSSGVKVSSGGVSNTGNVVSSGTAKLTSAGTYCWYAEFVPSAASAAAGVPGSHDDGSGGTGANPECFTVGPSKPALTTQASSNVAVNTTQLTDQATISGTATQPGTDGGNTTYPSINATNGAAAGGQINWVAYGPNDCTTSVMSTQSRTISGDGTYPTALQTAVGFTPTKPGQYTFVANYSGNLPNTTSLGNSSCSDSNEQAFAGSSSTKTTPEDSSGAPIGAGGLSIGTGSVQAKDHAAVTVNGISPWSGNVQFNICGPFAAASTSICASGGDAVGSPVAVSNTSTTADSPLTTFTEAGRYCWRADFTSSTTGVPNSSDGTATECFLVTPVTPTLATQASSGPVFVNTPISDTATLAGTASQPGSGGIGSDGSINPTTPGAAAGGNINWNAFGPNDCTTSAMNPTSRSVSGDGVYPTVSQTTVGFTPTKLGTYTFVASYDGDSPNTLSVGASACPDTTGTETVVVTGHAHDTSAQKFLPNDVVTLTGDSTLTGTLTVTLYNDGTCGNSGGSAVNGQQYTFTPNGDASGSTYPTTNTTFVINAANAGNYSWLVHYEDKTLDSPPDRCESSSISITDGP